MVLINKYTYPILKLYSSEGLFIGEISNPVELMDVRLQIVKNTFKGYYFTIGDERIDIDMDGSLDWMKFKEYDEESSLISAIFRAQKELREKEKK